MEVGMSLKFLLYSSFFRRAAVDCSCYFVSASISWFSVLGSGLHSKGFSAFLLFAKDGTAGVDTGNG